MYNYLKEKNHIRILRLRTPIWCHNNHSVPGAGVATNRHLVRGVNSMGTTSPSLRKDQVMSQTETGLHLRDTMTRMRYLLMSPGPQNVTPRYIYAFASHLNV